MECHGDRLPGRYASTVAKNTMSSMVKPAQELHECDVGQPTAACHVLVCPSRTTLVSQGDSSDPGRLEQKTPRSVSTAWRHWRLLPTTSYGEQCFLVSLSASSWLIPTNMVGQTCERVGTLRRLPREACYDQAGRAG